MKKILPIYLVLLFPVLSFAQSNQGDWERLLAHQWIVQPFSEALGSTQCEAGKTIDLQNGGLAVIAECVDRERQERTSGWDIASTKAEEWILELDGQSYRVNVDRLDTRVRLTLESEAGERLRLYRLLEFSGEVVEGE